MHLKTNIYVFVCHGAYFLYVDSTLLALFNKLSRIAFLRSLKLAHSHWVGSERGRLSTKSIVLDIGGWF